MIVLSFDVGIINLAYTVVEFIDDTRQFIIRDWNVTNIFEPFEHQFVNICRNKILSNFNGLTKLKSKGDKVKNKNVDHIIKALIVRLDEILKSISHINITHILIENQPAYKIPTMKSIASTINCYFTIRVNIDKTYFENVEIKYINPSNKIKLLSQENIKLIKESGTKKYSNTKKLVKNYITEIIRNDEIATMYLNSNSKGDDLCDCLAQAIWFYSKN